MELDLRLNVEVFVSHTSADDAFGRKLVAALRAAGADVWYDEHEMPGTTTLMDELGRQIRRRRFFVLILSRSALASTWVKREAAIAFRHWSDDQIPIILTVTAGPLAQSDFRESWEFLADLPRIEALGSQPYPQEEAINRTIHTLKRLAYTPERRMMETATPVEEPTAIGVAGRLSQWTNQQYKGGRLTELPPLLQEAKSDEEIRKVIPLLREVIERDVFSYRAWFGLAFALSTLKKLRNASAAYERALGAIENALILQPGNAYLWYEKAFILVQLQRNDDAFEAYENALSLVPVPGLGRFLPSLRRGEVGRIEDRVRAFALKYEDHAPLGYFWYLKGRSLLKQSKYDMATEAFENSCKTDECPRDTYYYLGCAYCGHGSRESLQKAEAALTRAVTVEPRNVEAWFQLGTILKKVQTQQAIRAFTHVVDIDAKHTKGWLQLGLAYAAQNMFEQALASFDSALAISPYDMSIMRAKYETQVRSGKKQQAVVTLEQIAALQNTGSSWGEVGQVYFELGDFGKADAMFEQAIAVEPRNKKWRTNRTRALLSACDEYKRQGCNEQALATLKKIASLEGTAKSWGQVGVFCADLQKNDEAEIAFDQAIALGRTDPKWLTHKVVILRRRERACRDVVEEASRQEGEFKAQARVLRRMNPLK